eukprot:scaffold39990_cov67-Phaeocystis_antarctica.AAC.1
MAHEHGVCVLCSYAYAHDDVEVGGRVGLDDQRCLEPREAALADADGGPVLGRSPCEARPRRMPQVRPCASSHPLACPACQCRRRSGCDRWAAPGPTQSQGRETGGFGGGSLEHPRQWRGVPWHGLFLGVSSCLEPPGVP